MNVNYNPGAEKINRAILLAVRAAEDGARVLVIETGVASAPSWLTVLAAIPRRQVLAIWPRAGVHPVPEDRGRAN